MATEPTLVAAEPLLLQIESFLVAVGHFWWQQVAGPTGCDALLALAVQMLQDEPQLSTPAARQWLVLRLR